MVFKQKLIFTKKLHGFFSLYAAKNLRSFLQILSGFLWNGIVHIGVVMIPVKDWSFELEKTIEGNNNKSGLKTFVLGDRSSSISVKLDGERVGKDGKENWRTWLLEKLVATQN